jgi:hypothetical protein
VTPPPFAELAWTVALATGRVLLVCALVMHATRWLLRI